MSKNSAPMTVSVTTSLATTQAITFADQVVGRIRVPSGSTITSLQFYDCEDLDGDYALATDSATAGVLTVEAGKSYRIPTELCGSRFLKLVGNAAGPVHLSFKG